MAFAQLKQLCEQIRRPDESLVIAVPPFYDQAQLGMVVAMARELELELRGLVASPIALDLATDATGTILVIDCSLHRGIVSVLEATDELRLERNRIAPEVGLHAFRRQWVKAIGEEFVRHTRFDPLHDADTEQQLHDGLADTLEVLAAEGSAAISLRTGAQVHRVTVTEQLLAHAGHGLVFRLVGDVQAAAAGAPIASIVLAHQAARIPGLLRALRQQIAAPIQSMEAGAAALGLVSLWPDRFDQSAAPAVAYHIARALRTERGEAIALPAPAAESEPVAAPTHLLAGDEAHPLRTQPLFVGVDAQTGGLLVGGSFGAASLRCNGEGVLLEVEPGALVRVDGVDVSGRSSWALARRSRSPGARRR